MSGTSTAEYQRLHAVTSSPAVTSPSAAAAGQFRPQAWDPLLILGQIGAVQSLYYLSSAFLVSTGSYFIGFSPTLKCLFDTNLLTVSTSTGKYFIAVCFLNVLLLSCALMLLVRRSKLCLDFVATCHLFHLIICWLYTLQFPSSATWWTVQIMSAVLATVFSEYLCMRVEMEAIPVSQSSKVDV